MSPQIRPSYPVVLLVGREDFTPPSSFGDANVAATHDCLAVGLRATSVGPVQVQIVPSTEASVVDRPDLDHLGDFEVESEGHLSVRDVHGREYDAMGVEAGTHRVTVLGTDLSEPDDVVFVVAVAS
ncbi:hypothetical protein GHK92_19265 [Nocardioides sp. dk4132]|uniref:hypothetical protein n=1 Tax=unclassified Nocardioides TaxID=2615069 RepID=UPI001297D9F9|nr:MULTISPECIES: hypothetical protein [unclassified Nocardioides]MQW78011.1 hypothetical protein [Nocardioides sp. dk4132]QGA08119.1 hypothetical protein GFH29_12445 [Nocardioides sp. dk884]